jgi:hypothetical protein
MKVINEKIGDEYELMMLLEGKFYADLLNSGITTVIYVHSHRYGDWK